MADIDRIIFSERMDELMRLAVKKAQVRMQYATEEAALKQKVAAAFKRLFVKGAL